MITRSVCKIREEYDVGLLDRLSNYVSEPITEDGYSLRNVVKLNPKIRSKDIAYQSGRLYYQKLFSIKDFEIEDTGEISENDSQMRRTLIADFWIKLNPGLILFSNKASSENGSKIISKILFDNTDSIKQMKFRIENIEKDVQAGLFTGMWAYSFKDRNGNIQKGQLFGDGDVNQDTMFGLTTGAPRNFIGIKKVINEEETKIKVTRSGSIIFFLTDVDLATEVIIQEIIADFLPYGYLE